MRFGPAEYNHCCRCNKPVAHGVFSRPESGPNDSAPFVCPGCAPKVRFEGEYLSLTLSRAEFAEVFQWLLGCEAMSTGITYGIVGDLGVYSALPVLFPWWLRGLSTTVASEVSWVPQREDFISMKVWTVVAGS